MTTIDAYILMGLGLTMLLPDTRTRKIAEEDQRRDLYYTAANPTPRAEVGDDVRVLQVDLQRRLLPTLHLVKLALAAGNSPDATAGLRKVLRDMVTENQDFVQLLAAPELHLVRARLMKLMEEPTDIEGEDAVQSSSMLVRILESDLPKQHHSRLLTSALELHERQRCTLLTGCRPRIEECQSLPNKVHGKRLC
jgi:hypothetical protein